MRRYKAQPNFELPLATAFRAPSRVAFLELADELCLPTPRLPRTNPESEGRSRGNSESVFFTARGDSRRIGLMVYRAVERPVLGEEFSFPGLMIPPPAPLCRSHDAGSWWPGAHRRAASHARRGPTRRPARNGSSRHRGFRPASVVMANREGLIGICQDHGPRQTRRSRASRTGIVLTPIIFREVGLP